MESDDAAGLLLRFDGGARGVCTISQVSAGGATAWRGRSTATESALAWASDDPDHLWIGHRGRPNEIVEKDPALLTPEGPRRRLPGRTRRGLPDTFRALFTAVYADIAAGAPSPQRLPTFADGHDIVPCATPSPSARRDGPRSTEVRR